VDHIPLSDTPPLLPPLLATTLQSLAPNGFVDSAPAPPATLTLVAAPCPPAEPPPTASLETPAAPLLTAFDKPPGSVFDQFYHLASPTLVRINLLALDSIRDGSAFNDSVTHVVCESRVCGLQGNPTSAVTTHPDPTSGASTMHGGMVDGGSNVCVTGNLELLLDVIDIVPIPISVAIEGVASSTADCITKCGLLPLTMTNGSYYYQPCFYCENLVKTIISPSAILASSTIFVQWEQRGYKHPALPGSIHFSNHDGLVSMTFGLRCHDGLYYCDSDVDTVDRTPVRVICKWTAVKPPSPLAVKPKHRPALKFTPTLRA
jgi:hypothetical protein